MLKVFYNNMQYLLYKTQLHRCFFARLIQGVEPAYDFFDHTADMGITVRAPSLIQLLAPAGDALYAAIGQLVAGDEPASVSFDLTAETTADLLRDYLGELLILFERDSRIVTDVDVATYTAKRLVATADTALVDHNRSVFQREVKAITYHHLGIAEIPGGYEATVIVDI